MRRKLLMVLMLVTSLLSLISLGNLGKYAYGLFKIVNDQAPSTNYVIMEVKNSSIAQEVGLQNGDIIQLVNGEEPYVLFESSANNIENVELVILRGTEEKVVALQRKEGQSIGIVAERARESFSLNNRIARYALFSTLN
jgi:C-terminal processing protease CtpA/Prc